MAAHISSILLGVLLLMSMACDGELSERSLGEASPRDMAGGAPLSDAGVVHDDMGSDAAGQPADSDQGVDMRQDMAAPEIQPRYMDPDYNPNRVYESRQDALFACTGAPSPWAYTLSRLQRIERREWVRNTGNWYGSSDAGIRDNKADANPFALSIPHGYTTYRQGVSLDSGVLSQYLNMIPAASKGWSNVFSYNRHQIARGRDLDCFYDEALQPDAACIQTWVAHYLEFGAYFRPATQEEISEWTTFAQGVIQDELTTEQSRQESVTLVISTIWMSLPALFRDEQPDAQPDGQGRVKLTDWQIAHQLASVLGRRAPGSPSVYLNFGSNVTHTDGEPNSAGHLVAIKQAAEDGTISDPVVLADLIRTYAMGVDEERLDLPIDWSPSARVHRGEYWMSEGLQRFFREWLDVDKLELIFKDTSYATSSFDASLDGELSQLQRLDRSYNAFRIGDRFEPGYLEQLDDMIARVVQQDEQVFESLLTTRDYYTPVGRYYYNDPNDTYHYDDMPQYVYGITDQLEETRTNRWVNMPSRERAGVLTHPAWLGAHSDNFENGTGIIYRGKWIRESLLCGDVNPVEGNIDAKLVAGDGKSARQRLDESTGLLAFEEKPECMACHVEMNPYGLPFETYNHAGYVRATDQGAPDGSSTLPSYGSGEWYVPPELRGVQVRDGVDFAEKLATSQHAKRCFIRQTFRYFMARAETQADACTLKLMEDAYTMSNGSFVEMLVALMTSDAFLYRLQSPPEIP